MLGRPFFITVLGISSVFLNSVNAQTCSSSKKCPQNLPACGEWGFCGASGSIQSLGGCQAQGSYSTDACQPTPLCKASDTKFSDLSRVQQDISQWDNDNQKYDWVVDIGKVLPTNRGTVLLSIKENSLGTRVAHTSGFVYGKFSVTMRTANANGIITTGILKNSVDSEVDMEFPGQSIRELQTVAWLAGKSKGGDFLQLSKTSDRSKFFTTYSVETKPNQIIWSVNGTVVKTLNREDTLTDGKYLFPQGAMIPYFSIWGAKDNQWAGGNTDWSKADPDFGYFAEVSAASVTCSSDPQAPSGATGYEFNGDKDDSGKLAMTYSTRNLVFSRGTINAGNSTSTSSTINTPISQSVDTSSLQAIAQSSQAQLQAGITVSSTSATSIQGSATAVPNISSSIVVVGSSTTPSSTPSSCSSCSSSSSSSSSQSSGTTISSARILPSTTTVKLCKPSTSVALAVSKPTSGTSSARVTTNSSSTSASYEYISSATSNYAAVAILLCASAFLL